jgi:hypothetical protein
MKEAEEQAQAEYEEFKRVRKANRRRRLRRKKKSDDAHTAENATPFVAKNKLKDFLNEGDNKAGKTGSQGEGGNGDEQEDNKYGSKPIADLFPAGMLFSSSVLSPNIALCLVSEFCRHTHQNCIARSHCFVRRYRWYVVILDSVLCSGFTCRPVRIKQLHCFFATGFTAWSSVREPTQVFQLLETLYHHFDEIANRKWDRRGSQPSCVSVMVAQEG